MKIRACEYCNNYKACSKKLTQSAVSCTQFVPTPSAKKSTKDTNPKDALGIKKAPMSTLPTGPAYEVALAMLEGARKYGRHNYRVMGVRGSVYYDASLRHLCAWWEGEDTDPDSGLNHIVKAIACLFVLRDSMLMENWTDDRPPQYPKGLNLTKLNKAAEEIIKKYPNNVEPFIDKKAKADSASVICNNVENCSIGGCSHFKPHKLDTVRTPCNFLCNGDGGKCVKVKED